MTHRVSSGKSKHGPPVHANTYAFHHNKSSKLTAHILALPVRFLCPMCTAVIEWRKKFRKYKPLTVAKKCTRCGEKRIKDAYHVVCEVCVRQHRICAKCLTPQDHWNDAAHVQQLPEAAKVAASGSDGESDTSQ